VDEDVDELHIPDPDLTQLGTKRGKLDAAWHFPRVRNAGFTVPFDCLTPVVGKKYLDIGADGKAKVGNNNMVQFREPTADDKILVVVSTNGVATGNALATRERGERLPRARKTKVEESVVAGTSASEGEGKGKGKEKVESEEEAAASVRGLFEPEGLTRYEITDEEEDYGLFEQEEGDEFEGLEGNALLEGRLHRALKPTMAATGAALLNSPLLVDFLKRIDTEIMLITSTIQSWLLPVLQNDAKLLRDYTALGLASSDADTAGDEMIIVNPSAIRDCTYEAVLKLGVDSALMNAPNMVRKAIEKLDYWKLRRNFPESDSAVNHSAVAGIIARARAEAAVTGLSEDDELTRLITPGKNYHINGVTVKLYYLGKRQNGNIVEIEAKLGEGDATAKKVAWLQNFGVFLVNYIIPAENDVEQKADFAFTRVILARYNLLFDSDEISVKSLTTTVDIPKSVFDAFRERLSKPEVPEAAVMISCISYLKAGHHATMYNIDTTTDKVLRAVSTNLSDDQIEKLIRSSVYYGAHVCSTRLAIYWMLKKAQTDDISRALSARMHPVPPTFAAVCNLEIFIDSLANAGFFAFTDKTSEYKEFHECMRRIRQVMFFAAPYSKYLYGETKPEPLADKAYALNFAAYASAIREVLPNGTLGLSPALINAANLASVNNIEAQLLVSSYVAAFRRFFKLVITQKMRNQVSGGNRLPEPE